MKSTFPKSQRWEHIRQVACRTSFKIGPGCYNTPLSTNKGRSARIVKDATFVSSNCDYVYVGESIVRKERSSSRGNGLTSRYSYQTDRTMSPYSSRHVGNEGNFGEMARRSMQRPVSAGRQRVNEYSYNRETLSPKRETPSNPSNQRSPVSSDRRRASSNDYYQSRGIPYGKRIYPTYDHPSGGYSPTSKQKTPGSPGKSSLKVSKSLRGDELLNVKEKDFYAALQEQWGIGKKVVIHNDKPASRDRKNVEGDCL